MWLHYFAISIVSAKEYIFMCFFLAIIRTSRDFAFNEPTFFYDLTRFTVTKSVFNAPNKHDLILTTTSPTKAKAVITRFPVFLLPV